MRTKIALPRRRTGRAPVGTHRRDGHRAVGSRAARRRGIGRGTSGGVTGHETIRELASAPSSVGQARAIVLDVGEGLPDGVLQDAELLVSELVSNAVRHGGAGIRLEARSDDGGITVRVYDDGRALPAMRSSAPGLEMASGRGLWMVEQLAGAWGVEIGEAGGKTVWFRMASSTTGRGLESHETGSATAWS
jgi:anti-sigma regulatory factor (Ser/Thr protein kinase)